MGTVFRLVTQDPQLAKQVDALLVDLETTSKPARASNIIQVAGEPGAPKELYKGCLRRASNESANQVLTHFVAVINQTAVNNLPQFAVHAAVLSEEERIIAFPAISGAGKTTLAAAGVLAELDYVSDEALVFDDEGRVIPYPKPMALSSWSCEKLGLDATGEERLVTAAELGGKALTETQDLTDVVIATYGSDELALEPIPSSRAVVELIGKSFNHYKDPERAFRLATQTAQRTRVWRLDYDDPVEAIELIRRELG